jgi:hypothetical protein
MGRVLCGVAIHRLREGTQYVNSSDGFFQGLGKVTAHSESEAGDHNKGYLVIVQVGDQWLSRTFPCIHVVGREVVQRGLVGGAEAHRRCAGPLVRNSSRLQ